MATFLHRRVSRETSEIDANSGQPIILTLEAGGKIVRLRPKGRRTEYIVTVKQLWMMGAQNKAVELRRQKEQDKKERAKRNV